MWSCLTPKIRAGGWGGSWDVCWETIWESEGLVWIILTSEAVSISVKQVEKSGIKDAGVNTGWYPRVTDTMAKRKAWHSPTLPKLKKKKTFQERKYLTKMQCWIIQCDVSPQIFRKILYTKSMVVCMWVCVVRGRWGICFGRVFILGRRWEERGEGRERGRNLIRFGSPWCVTVTSSKVLWQPWKYKLRGKPKRFQRRTEWFIRWEWWFKSSPCKLQWTGSPQLLSQFYFSMKILFTLLHSVLIMF